MILRLLAAAVLGLLTFRSFQDPPEGLFFTFKNKKIALNAGMHGGKSAYFPRGRYTDAELDTLSNWYSLEKKYIEIIRQDDPFRPNLGVALGFEFDESNGEYPYTPAKAVIQLKDFGWGGMEFSRRDTMNYTGISNDVSEDLFIEIDGFNGDTVWGRFSGVLVSGAGPMAGVEEGNFRVRVYRVP